MSSGVTADTNTSAAMKAGSSATATVLQRAIQEQAKHLGMDIEKDKEFFWLAKEIVKRAFAKRLDRAKTAAHWAIILCKQRDW